MSVEYVHIPIFVRTGKQKTQLYAYQKERQAFLLDVAARPIDGDANAEILFYFKKYCKMKGDIISGRTNRRKIIRFGVNEITLQLSRHELPEFF